MKKRQSILLVEDEAIAALYEKQQLENIGYSVHHVLNGEGAIQSSLNENYDLILMDIDLGSGIDGTQAAVKILKSKDIPIIFLSSHTEPKVVKKTEKITSYGYVVKNSGIVVLEASIKMALKLFNEKTERKRAEKQVLLSKENYRFQFLNMNSYNSLYEVLTDKEGKPYDFRFIMVNYAYEEYVGKKASELIGKTLLEVYPKTEQYWIDKMSEAVLTDKPLHFQNFSQEMNTYTEINLYIPKKGQLAMTTANINERKQAEEALRKSEEKFRTLHYSMMDAFVSVDMNGNIIEYNESYLNLLGYSQEEISNLTYKDITPEKWHAMEANIVEKQIMQNGYSDIYEKEYRKKDGTVFPIELRTILMEDTNGSPTSMWAIVRDITKRKLAQEKIKNQLAEKEILLREVHHRVKNNIANIEGILSLQSSSTANPDVKEALDDAVSRIQSMRILYEKLLLSNDYDDISIKSYTENLIHSLLEIFNNRNNITIEKQISEFNIISKQAISVGIIINELLTNVFKYAFKDRDNGNIFISINKNKNLVNMIIHDNGVGFDEKKISNKSKGFGLTIIKMLTEQLNGSYNMINENGTKSIIQFEI